MRSGILRTAPALALAFALTASLSACGGSGSDPGSEERPGAIRLEHAPIGAKSTYMAYTDDVRLNASAMKDIRDALDEPHNAQARDVIDQVLADGVISAEEMNDVERRAVTCLADRYGLELGSTVYIRDTGGLSFDMSHVPKDQVGQVASVCMDDTGYTVIGTYYSAGYSNPDNVDLEPYRYQCYKEHDLLAKDYSYEEYERLKGNSPVPLLKGGTSTDPLTAKVLACVSDPLHNITNSPLKQ